MKRFRKFLILTRADQWLLIRAAVLLGVITVGLRLLPFMMLQRLLERAGRVQSRRASILPPRTGRLAWAVWASSRVIPGAVCLPQALAVQLLFRRYGYPAQLQIGVAKNEQGQLEAHAWIESDERVVIGGSPDLARYTRLPDLKVKRL